jgi:hypothetical protein
VGVQRWAEWHSEARKQKPPASRAYGNDLKAIPSRFFCGQLLFAVTLKCGSRSPKAMRSITVAVAVAVLRFNGSDFE